MLTNLTIRVRLMILVGLFAAGLIAATVANRTATKSVKVGGELYSEIIENKDLLADVLPPPAYIVDTHAAVLTLALLDPESADSEKDRAQAFADIERGKNDFEARIAHWKAHSRDSKLLATLSQAADKATEYFRVLESDFLPAFNNADSARAKKILNAQLTPLFTDHRSGITGVVTMAINASKELETRSAQRVSAAITQSLFITASLFAFVVAATWIVGRSITKPLNFIVDRMRQISSGSGNLRTRVPGEDADSELGQLARSFNGFANTVQSIIREISVVSGQLRTGTQTIADATESTSRSMDQQSLNANQIASDADAVASSGTSVAGKASQATETAINAGKQAEEGFDVVDQTIRGMREIEASVTAGAESVTALGQRSEQIGRIITVIKDIADQTNLLALNAAIEAARAGSHGRGFAVVADEVRKLAERTTSATGEVTQAIQQIQSETSSAVDRIGESRKRVNDGVELATRASSALKNIVASVSQTTNMISAIAAEVQQQAGLSCNIRERIQTVAATSADVSRANTSTNDVSNKLAETARRLDEAVAKFEIDPSPVGQSQFAHAGTTRDTLNHGKAATPAAAPRKAKKLLKQQSH